MPPPKIPISIKILKDSRTDADLSSLKESLETLVKEAEQFHNLRDVFESALLAMYCMQPNGMENYGSKHTKICKIQFGVPRNNSYGCIDLHYLLTGGTGSKESRFVKVNLKSNSLNGCLSRIVRINFIEKTYCPLHISWGKSCSRADYLFQKDTKNIMNYLGLKRKRR